MTQLTDELLRAYTGANYLAYVENSTISIRVGQQALELSEILRRLNQTTWAYLCAANPRSRQLSETENQERHKQLLDLLKGAPHAFYEGVAVAEQDEWPEEKSALVIGISEVAARKIALRFNQHAFLFGELDGLVTLCLTNC